MYFKITNKKENHHGFQYKDGLNVLIEEFNHDATQSCCAGGFYFTDLSNIFKFLDYGIYLREVILPTDILGFKMIKDKSADKWRANMIILGKRYDLSNIDTYKYLIKCGANVHAGKDFALLENTEKGYLDIIKYLIECGADVHAEDEYALRVSAQNGQLDLVKYLIKCGANIHARNNYALRNSAQSGHLDVVKYLIECGADLRAYEDYALQYSAENGHSDIVKYLVECGANVHADGDYALRCYARNNQLDMVKFLVEKGADIHAKKDYVFRYSAGEVHEYLTTVDKTIPSTVEDVLSC